MRIFTHVSVDLDAVSSVWAARLFIPDAAQATVEYRTANWNGDGMNEGDLALDIHANGRGMKGECGENGIVHSCFALIVKKYASPEDQTALEPLMCFVDAQDAHGSAVKFLAPEVRRDAREVLSRTGLNAVLRALQAVHPHNDAIVLARMSEIFSGMLKSGRNRRRAVLEAKKAEILPGGTVAIVRNPREYATNGILFEEHGIRVIVYVDGNNLGIIRNNDDSIRMDHPDLRAVVEAAGETDEWFAHSAGFLFCRGSRKNPVMTPSNVDPRALAEAAAKLLA